MTIHQCIVCDNRLEGQGIVIRDMMFAARNNFVYFECTCCGTLQLPEVPSDLGAYYPVNYYSFETKRVGTVISSGLRFWIRRQRTAHNIGCGNIIGAMIQRVAPAYFGYDWNWFRRAEITPNSSILDIGCGSGRLLGELRDNGFSNLHGADPFIAADIHEPGLSILKASIDKIQGRYDLVMLHHSLEHTPNPREVLRSVRSLLNDGGTVLVRIPIAGSYAWRTYRENWVQVDAPRHLFLPTENSMIALAAQVGLRCTSVVFDAGRLMLLGSEVYARDLPLYQQNGRFTYEDPDMFSESTRQDYALLTARLNHQKDSDQACFHFRIS